MNVKASDVGGPFVAWSEILKKLGKKGYTLVEVLVVVAIMGILSAMGVVGLQGAVENNRVKDAALNITAFLERVANESNRMSTSLCLTKTSSQRIEARECGEDGQLVAYFELESPMQFETSCDNVDCDSESCDSWLNSESAATFKPKFGLSAAPASGYVCAQYGPSSGHFAGAVKKKTKNSIIASSNRDGESNWIEF